MNKKSDEKPDEKNPKPDEGYALRFWFTIKASMKKQSQPYETRGCADWSVSNVIRRCS